VQQLVSTDFYILLGALAVGLLFRPSGNLLDIRYAFVVTVLLGLCGPSVLLLLTGDRVENAFIVPKLIPLVHRYATVCVLLFWVGYYAGRWRWWGKERETPPDLRLLPDDGQRLLVALLVLATIPLVLEIVNYGTDYVFGEASVRRGFYAQNKTDKPLLEYTRVLGKALSFPVAVVAGVAWQQRRQKIYWLVPVLLSIPLVAYFSRGMFLSFVVFLLGACFRLPARKRLLYLAIASVFAMTSFLTGIAMRKYTANTGLAQYSNLFDQQGMEVAPVKKNFDKPFSALIDATDALSVATKVFDVGPRIEGRMWKGYLLVQLPIPSFLLPKGVPTTNLTDDLHYHGARFPYPLMGEMFVFFGWFGSLIYVFVGWFAGRTDRIINDRDALSRRPYFSAILYGLVLFMIVREFHSGLRSSLRPTMYFFGAYLIWTMVRPRAVPVVRRDPLAERLRALPPRIEVDRVYPSGEAGRSG